MNDVILFLAERGIGGMGGLVGAGIGVAIFIVIAFVKSSKKGD